MFYERACKEMARRDSWRLSNETRRLQILVEEEPLSADPPHLQQCRKQEQEEQRWQKIIIDNDLDNSNKSESGKPMIDASLRSSSAETSTNASSSQGQSNSHQQQLPDAHHRQLLPVPLSNHHHGTDATLRSSGLSSSNQARTPSASKLPASEFFLKYGHKLTSFEKEEIKSYRQIFYIGLDASQKITPAPTVGDRNSGFDDAEGHYRCVVGDHIAYRYEIISLLGSGTFGIVIKALDHKRQIHVAIKIGNAKCDEQALMEIEVLKYLHSHGKMQNIVMILNDFVFRGHVCIVMELLQGGDLYALLKKGGRAGFSIDHTRKRIKEVLQCLEALHRRKVIHCDIKPDNVMLADTDGEDVKLIDFGYCCINADDKPYDCVQCLYYRAPEVILGCNFGLAIDMWSVGCMAAEFITGRPLFSGRDEDEQLMYQMELLGVPSRKMVAQGRCGAKFFKPQSLNAEPLHIHDKNGSVHLPGTTNFQILLGEKVRPEVIDFVSRCIRMEPSERMTVIEALNHPFITNDGLFDAKLPRISLSAVSDHVPVSPAPSDITLGLTDTTRLSSHDMFVSKQITPSSAGLDDYRAFLKHSVPSSPSSNSFVTLTAKTTSAAVAHKTSAIPPPSTATSRVSSASSTSTSAVRSTFV